MEFREFSLAVLVLFGLGFGEVEAQKLYFMEAEGNQSAYFLSDIRKITFSSGNMTVQGVGGDTSTHVLAEMLNLNFHQPTSVLQQTGPVKPGDLMFIYPNPVKETLFLHVSLSQRTSRTLEIISMEGRLVKSADLNSSASNYEIDIADLPNGLYVLKVSHGSSFEVLKFIKH